ncbi:MAG: DbpA RNA binding domain-containing protein, partial [Chitinophagales bacterium]
AGDEVVKNQLAGYLKELIEAPVDNKSFTEWRAMAEKELAAISKEELIEKILALKLKDIVTEHSNAPDLNRKAGKGSRDGGSSYGSDRDKFATLFINLGEMDKLDKGGMLRFICENSNAEGSSVGKIDVKREFSFVDVQKELADDIIGQLRGAKMKNRPVKVEVAERSQSRGGGNRNSGGGRNKKKGFKKKSFNKSEGFERKRKRKYIK